MSYITWAADGRNSILLSNMRIIRSFASFDTFFHRLLLNFNGSPFATDSMTLKSSAPGNGGSPTNNTYNMTPSDQISHFSL